MAQLAKGITVSFSTMASKLLDIKPGDWSRPGVKVTHQASGTYEEMIAGAFIENKPITMTVQYLATENYQTLMELAATTLTITLPVPSGYTNGATIANTAWISNMSQAYKLADVMVIDLEFTPTGGPTYTVAS